MSFILDALKKSESERQRQSGPALFEVKIAPPRSRFAVWGAAIAALLAINFFVVGFWLWHGSASRAAPSAPAEQAGARPASPSAVSAGARDGTRPESTGAPSAAAAPTAVAAVSTSSNPAAARAPAEDSGPSRVAAAAADAGANPDDLAPAVEPPHGAASPPATPAAPVAPAAPVTHATESGLPTYQDAAAEPGAEIPSLRLDLHVYSPQPNQRFVFLNMLKLREGDTTPQGVRVERITEDGVILSYRGKEFVLQRQ